MSARPTPPDPLGPPSHRADVPEEWRDLGVDLTPGHVVRSTAPPGPPGPPTHEHEGGSRCMWVRRYGVDSWRQVDATGRDLGPCADTDA